jgi:hypothetical protein
MPTRFAAQQRRAMEQVVKLQTAHAVEVVALLGARSAEAAREHRASASASSSRRATRGRRRAPRRAGARAAAERRHRGGPGGAEDLAATRVEQRTAKQFCPC